jgi:hypothetical protein
MVRESRWEGAKYKLLSILSFSNYPEQEIEKLLDKFYYHWRRRELPDTLESLKKLKWAIQFADSVLYKPHQEFMELAVDDTRNPQMLVSLYSKAKILKKVLKKMKLLQTKIPLSPRLKREMEKIHRQLKNLVEKVEELIEAMKIGQKVKGVVEEIAKEYPEVVGFWIGKVENEKAVVYLETDLGVEGACLIFDNVTHHGLEIINQLEDEINEKFARPFISHYYIA